jgi:hypothetical protein
MYDKRDLDEAVWGKLIPKGLWLVSINGSEPSKVEVYVLPRA